MKKTHFGKTQKYLLQKKKKAKKTRVLSARTIDGAADCFMRYVARIHTPS